MSAPLRTAVTVSLVPEARGGPFVLWDGLERSLEKAAAMGFDGVEIFPPSAEDIDARQLRQLLERHKLQLAAVGTGAGWVVRKLRLSDPDASVRGRARDFIASIIDLAGKLGAPAIIGSMQGRVEPGVDRSTALAWVAEILEQLGPRAHAYGVPLLLEPLNRYETNLFNTIDDTLAFLDGLKTRNVKLLCDCFHMNIEESDIAAALVRAGDRVGHVHLADSNRRAAGMGHIDFRSIHDALHLIGYQGFLSAEVLPLPDADAACLQTLKAAARPARDGARIVHIGPGGGRAFSAVGDVYRILAGSEDTGGAYVMAEARVLPGGGPPPHIHHREDEAFYILEGEITFSVEGRSIPAPAGSFIQGPRGIPHSFRNEGTVPARMLILVLPSGFDRFLAAFGTPVASFAAPPIPPSPEEIQRLLQAAPGFGIEMLPPAGPPP